MEGQLEVKMKDGKDAPLTSAVSIRSDFLSSESIALTTSVTVSANALKLTSIGAAGDLPLLSPDGGGGGSRKYDGGCAAVGPKKVC